MSGPIINFCGNNNCSFIPLHGEHDEERQFGVSIPYRGWNLDIDTFKTNAGNFLDHNNIGASNIFFPVTIQHAVVRAWETTVRSPRLANRAQLHLAYSNQIAEGNGVLTGGLTGDSSSSGLSPLDHDQRNTLNVGADVTLPRVPMRQPMFITVQDLRMERPIAGQPYQGAYLPAHTTFDISAGKDFGERFTASLTVLNVANHRVLYDNSLTYGGYHWNLPRKSTFNSAFAFIIESMLICEVSAEKRTDG